MRQLVLAEIFLIITRKADENSHEITGHHQKRFSINMSVGIFGDDLVSPCMLPARLTAADTATFCK
jgi:hypothetical protein